ncbi:MAG: AAA family ATPase [Candidatus Acidiferrum sp.]
MLVEDDALYADANWDHLAHSFDNFKAGEDLKKAVDAAREKRIAQNMPVPWRTKFHTGSELEVGDVRMYIDRFLPEGITAIGGLSAVGKTWLGLSLSKALTTGQSFLDVFRVLEKMPVLYSVPEMGARAVRNRLEKMHVPMNDMFYCQTIADGVCSLKDRALEDAIKELKPAVLFDTLVRFSPAADENASKQNAQLLAQDIFDLLRIGARAVIGLHHSPKIAGTVEEITLENVLRGTGDFGAMCDSVWGVSHDRAKANGGKNWDYDYLDESQGLTRLFIKNVKARDFEPHPAFRIQGRPSIDSKGDFVVLTEDPDIEERIVKVIAGDPRVAARDLMARFRVGYPHLKKIAQAHGWRSGRDGWKQPGRKKQAEKQAEHCDENSLFEELDPKKRHF